MGSILPQAEMATIQTEVPNEIWHMIHDGPEETSTGDYVAVVQKPGVDTDSNSSDSAAMDEDGIRYAMRGSGRERSRHSQGPASNSRTTERRRSYWR